MSERIAIHECRYRSKCNNEVVHDYVLDCPLAPGKKVFVRSGENGGRRCVSCPYLLVLRKDYVACRCRYIQQMSGAADRL